MTASLRVLVVVALLSVTTACSSDPGAGLAAKPDADERYAAWIGRWRDEANGWSRVWVAREKAVAASQGSISRSEFLDMVEEFETAAAALDSGLEKAGPLDSPAAPPTYVDALHWTIDHVQAHVAAARTCSSDCADELDGLLRSGLGLESLVVRTSSVYRTPYSATRTVPVGKALLTARDIDGLEDVDIADRPDPLTYLCTPAYERGDRITTLATPKQTEATGLATRERLPVFENLHRWPTSVGANGYFQTVVVRTLTCPLESVRRQDGYVDSWKREYGIDLGVPTAAWRSTSQKGTSHLYSLGVAALVDDTVVTLVVLSAIDPPTTDEGERLLRLAVRGLGVDPDTSADAP